MKDANAFAGALNKPPNEIEIINDMGRVYVVWAADAIKRLPEGVKNGQWCKCGATYFWRGDENCGPRLCPKCGCQTPLVAMAKQ